MKAKRFKHLDVETTQGPAGSLHRESQFVFRYHDEALGKPERAISLTMPPRPEGYTGNQLPPALAMNLPEGFLKDRARERYRKVLDVEDDMNLLALTSTPTSGRVWTRSGEVEAHGPSPAMALRDLLAAPGTEALFDDLVERFATNTAISGIQPKVVVPEAMPEALPDAFKGGGGRASIRSPDLIVKAAGAEFPGLAENEYFCMSMAREAGLEVPECWLSEDRLLFVIRRFDMRPDNTYLGFEDLASLTGRHPTRKYEASYGIVAKALGDFCAPRHRASSLERYFRQLVFCCLIENGDAHLKNWGVLYGDPSTAERDARLSPVYDMVCTTAWLPQDVLALSLEGSRAWPARENLEAFGRERCGLSKPGALIDEVVERAMGYAPEEKTEAWGPIARARERRGWSLAAAGRSRGV